MSHPGHAGTGDQKASSKLDVHRILYGHLSETLEMLVSVHRLRTDTTLQGTDLTSSLAQQVASLFTLLWSLQGRC